MTVGQIRDKEYQRGSTRPMTAVLTTWQRKLEEETTKPMDVVKTS